MSTAKKAGATGAGAILLATAFIMPWEGLWTTAQVDTIGTGRPVTYCYGQTNEAGNVRAGQKFTPQQCSDLLAKTLPKYADEIAPASRCRSPTRNGPLTFRLATTSALMASVVLPLLSVLVLAIVAAHATR